MDSFELTHFPLELILVEGKMISDSRRINEHDSMLVILCTNQDFMAMLEVSASTAKKENRMCLHQLYFQLGGYFISDLHSLCKKLKNRARKLSAKPKPNENRPRQDDTTMDESSGEAGQ